MKNLHELIKSKDGDWIERNLLTAREPRNPDIEALTELMVGGMSPHLAAKEVFKSGESSKEFEGLRWLAYETEEQLFETLGDGLDGYIETLIKVGSVEILPSRVRRLIQKAASRGLKTRSATMVELKT